LDESSFQWGLGVSYAAMDGVDLFFDFIRFMDNGDINSRLYDYDPVTYYKLTVNGITFGINYKF
jgi:opacity protein-like surface antigen